MTSTKKRGGKGWMKRMSTMTPFRKKHAKRLLQKQIGEFFNEDNDGKNTKLEQKIEGIEAKIENFETRIEKLEETQPKDMDNTSSSDNDTQVIIPLPPPGPPKLKTPLTANERRQAAAEMNELLEKVDPAPIDPFVNENLLENRNIGQKEVGVEQQVDEDLIDIKSPLQQPLVQPPVLQPLSQYELDARNPSPLAPEVVNIQEGAEQPPQEKVWTTHSDYNSTDWTGENVYKLQQEIKIRGLTSPQGDEKIRKLLMKSDELIHNQFETALVLDPVVVELRDTLAKREALINAGKKAKRRIDGYLLSDAKELRKRLDTVRRENLNIFNPNFYDGFYKTMATEAEKFRKMGGRRTKKRGNMYKTTQRRIHKRLKTNKKKHVPKRKKTHKK